MNLDLLTFEAISYKPILQRPLISFRLFALD